SIYPWSNLCQAGGYISEIPRQKPASHLAVAFEGRVGEWPLASLLHGDLQGEALNKKPPPMSEWAAAMKWLLRSFRGAGTEQPEVILSPLVAFDQAFLLSSKDFDRSDAYP